MAYIDAKLDEYNKALAQADGDNKKSIEEEIKKHTGRKNQLLNRAAQIELISN